MANVYNISLAPKAERQFRKLARQVQVRLTPKIDALARTPRPRGVKKLSKEEDLYRIQIGDYRVAYEICDKARSIVIAKVRHRREIYRQK